jgi:hypothetical protein
MIGVTDGEPRWRRTISFSTKVGVFGAPFAVVRELDGVTFPCPSCGRPDTASIRRWRKSWFVHCRGCIHEERISQHTAEEMVAQVVPEAVDRLFA